MSHRAQQVIDAVVSIVGAAVTPLGVKVYAHRRMSLSADQDELPAISVDFGNDESDLEDEGSTALLSKLSVMCSVVVAQPEEEDVRTELLDLCRQIQIAIMADRRLGLSFFARAYRVRESDQEPDRSGAGVIVGGRVSEWLVHYFMNIADPGD